MFYIYVLYGSTKVKLLEPTGISGSEMATHLTRPKSSKGRSRTSINFFPSTESNPQPHGSPISVKYGRLDTEIRSQSQPEMRHSRQTSQEQVLQELHNASAGQPRSLNKYKVLPSIESGRARHSPVVDLDKELSNLSLTDGHILKGSQRHQGAGPTTGSHVTSICSSDEDRKVALPDTGSASCPTNTLLLAIKEPGGRRFQQHFHPTDTLLRVRASAEAKYGVKYAEASIETMEVPRRTFTDMSMTLDDCGIMNKSVLCIFQQLDD